MRFEVSDPFGKAISSAGSANTIEAVSSIDDLDLVDYAKEAAKKLRDTHPSVMFTSGRRNVKEQAEAMAGNVVQNRNWIKETCVQCAERDSLQKWVDDPSGGYHQGSNLRWPSGHH